MTDVELLREYAGFSGTPIEMRAVLLSSAIRIEELEKSLGHCVRAIAEWQRKPEGIEPYLLGALDHARKTLEPQP